MYQSSTINTPEEIYNNRKKDVSIKIYNNRK